jgi:predicted TIM-barrel fold metal-dependent hydrolase
MTTFLDDLSAREIREQLGHPVIDGDGHLIEVREAFVRYVHERGHGEYFDDAFARGLLDPGQVQLSPGDVVGGDRGLSLIEHRRRAHSHKPNYFFTPGNTMDWAAVTMPALMHERMDETGFDFAVVYPTYGLHIAHVPDDEARRGLCRLFNEMVAEDYAPYRDRLSPVAILPLSTPEEGIDGLEHAVSLGLKAFLMPSYVWRTIPAFADAPAAYRSRLRRMDTFGLDSEFDYDPFWRRAVDLNAPLATHLSGAGLPDHVSPSNAVFAAGEFSATGEAVAKSLFLGGVIARFPRLRVGLLEGGVAHGVRLLGDLISRYEKRGPDGLRRLDPRGIDPEQIRRLASKYNRRLVGLPGDRLVPPLAADEGTDNDYELSRVRWAEDIVDQFCRAFFWGCEGDDPLIRVAFDGDANPSGAVVPAFIGSDIGHWDVPAFDYALREAYEQVDGGLLTAEQFEDFSFTNAVRFYAGDRSDFFAGTAVEGAVDAWLASSPARATVGRDPGTSPAVQAGSSRAG